MTDTYTLNTSIKLSLRKFHTVWCDIKLRTESNETKSFNVSVVPLNITLVLEIGFNCLIMIPAGDTGC